jgi:predicted SnoaL-like aldol condensation-catalyzing enzyme
VKAPEKYISEDKYIQHNPQRGDLVIIHSRCKKKEAGLRAAIVYIFRAEMALL